LNRISGYDTPLNSNFRTSLESELIGYTEDFDTSSITMVDDLCSLDVAIQSKTINLEELQSKVTDTYHLDIQSQLTILNNQITSYKDTLETRDITIRTLKLNTDSLNSRIEKLLKALVVNDLKIIDLESKIDEDVYKIGELVNEIDSLKSNKTTLNEELDKFQELLHDNNKIIDSNYEELYSLKEQIIELNRQISFLNNTKSEFEELLRSNDQELIEHYNETKVLKAKVEEYEFKTNNILEELKLEKSKSEEYLE
jgi:chromosome segregation ATPase